MITESYITLQKISKEQFNIVYDLLKQEDLNYVSFYYKDVNGILYNEKIIGLFKLKGFIDNSLSIDIAILSEYRGKGLASIASDKIVKIYGEKYPNIKRFIANTSPFNESANRSLKKSSWKQTYEYDELMINEDSEFFNIYYKENPHYEKKKILLKKRRKNGKYY